MGRFVAVRLLHGLVVVAGVVVIVFVVTRMVGDPITFVLPLEATEEQRAARSAALGFDQPILTQFVDYLGDLARLDFRDSLWQQGRPTIDIVWQVLPKSLYLVAAGMSLAVVLSLLIGVLAALHPGRLIDRALVTLSMIGLSLPQFWLGLILIIVFGVQLKWFPTAGTGSLRHLVLPATTLALPAAGRLGMIVRSSMIDELNQQYVRTSKAKGMPVRRTVGVHALRNGAIPIVTLVGWETIRALAGYTVVVETVFNWPGLGQTAITAIQRQDLFLLQTIVLVVAVMVVTINTITDIIYRMVDPRLEAV